MNTMVCQHCQNPSQQPLCHTCTQQLDSNLHSLKDGLPALRAIAAKKASVIGKQNGHGSQSIAPIPLNLGAWQLLQDIIKLVDNMARAIGLPYRRLNTEALLKGIIGNLSKLINRRDVNAIIELCDQAAYRLRKTLEKPESVSMIGPCPSCGCELWCTPLEITSGYKECDRCHDTHRVKDVQQQSFLRIAMYGGRGTSASISRMVTPYGLEIKRKTIDKWGERDIIKPIAKQDNAPVYLVWDVWQAYTRKRR